jgi:triosephosphate isomerase
MRKLAAGNWKMNGLKADGMALAGEIAARANRDRLDCDILVCPPAPLFHVLSEVLAGSPVALGAQNLHQEASGAHTGELSAQMLVDAGCSYVILGHSERRAAHRESNMLVRKKVAAARKAGLIAIVCIGETLKERDAGETLAIVSKQLAGSLPPKLDSKGLVVAYEPVWAIGTGRTPTIEQVAEVHGHIRHVLAGRVADSDKVRILYGGSVKPSNAAELMAVPHVDGALIGGASLVAADFWAIAQACV